MSSKRVKVGCGPLDGVKRNGVNMSSKRVKAGRGPLDGVKRNGVNMGSKQFKVGRGLCLKSGLMPRGGKCVVERKKSCPFLERKGVLWGFPLCFSFFCGRRALWWWWWSA